MGKAVTDGYRKDLSKEETGWAAAASPTPNSCTPVDNSL